MNLEILDWPGNVESVAMLSDVRMVMEQRMMNDSEKVRHCRWARAREMGEA